jgi:HNH endonuclease
MLLCDATVTSVWLDATGKPFDVGTSLTEIPARNRRAVIARDGCCRYLGCGRPSRWTEIHHMVHREDLGNHDIDNLVTLCRFHHRFIHRHRLKLEWDTDGITLVIRWPNGQTIHSPPTPKATLTDQPSGRKGQS